MTREQLASEVGIIVEKMRDQVQTVKLEAGFAEKRWPNSSFARNSAAAAALMATQLADIEKIVGGFAASSGSP